jgi:phage shock protein C
VVLWIVMPEEKATYAAPQALPNHPRPVEEWKFDPYTGEPVRKQPFLAITDMSHPEFKE